MSGEQFSHGVARQGMESALQLCADRYAHESWVASPRDLVIIYEKSIMLVGREIAASSTQLMAAAEKVWHEQMPRLRA